MEQRRREGVGVARAAAAALVLVCASVSAAAPGERYERVEPAMGTLFRVTLYAGSEAEARTAFDAAFALARSLDSRLSDYRGDSELNELCRVGDARPVQVSEELFAVMDAALDLARRSEGAFDPTLGPLTRLWRESRRTGRLPDPGAVAEARSRTGWKKVRLDRASHTIRLAQSGMQLDLGGIGKGFAADRMLAMLEGQPGVDAVLVAASGDLAVGAAPPGVPGWAVRIGPDTLTLAHCGVSTSGAGEQFAEIGGRRYSHLLDPRTGLGLPPAGSRRTVSVIAPNATVADGLATMAAVLLPRNEAKVERLMRRWKGVRWMANPAPLP